MAEEMRSRLAYAVEVTSSERSADACSPTEVAQRFGDAVRRIAFLVTRSDSAAHDVAQEVFVRVLSRGGFDPSRGSYERWLKVVTRSTAVDWVRREAAHQRRTAGFGSLHHVSTPLVEEAVTDRLQAAHVRTAVEQLPEGERDVVVLAYFDGLTYRQVAAQLGLAEGTVKSRIRRALTRLAHVIGPDVEHAKTDSG